MRYRTRVHAFLDMDSFYHSCLRMLYGLEENTIVINSRRQVISVPKSISGVKKMSNVDKIDSTLLSGIAVLEVTDDMRNACDCVMQEVLDIVRKFCHNGTIWRKDAIMFKARQEDLARVHSTIFEQTRLHCSIGSGHDYREARFMCNKAKPNRVLIADGSWYNQEGKGW